MNSVQSGKNAVGLEEFEFASTDGRAIVKEVDAIIRNTRKSGRILNCAIIEVIPNSFIYFTGIKHCNKYAEFMGTL
jgi:hypothetical protein